MFFVGFTFGIHQFEL